MTATYAFTMSPAEVAQAVADHGVDQFGRSLDDPDAIRANYRGRPVNDGDDDDDDDSGDDDDDDADDDDADDDDTAGKKKAGKKKPPAKKTGKDKGGDDTSDDDDDDDDPVAAANKRAEEAEARAKKAEADARKLKRADERRKRQQQQDDGEYKELYETEKARADGLEKKLREGAMERYAITALTEAGAKKPASAFKLLDLNYEDVVDEDGEVDEDAVNAAVRTLKKSDKYAFKGEDAQSSDLNGDRKNGRRRSGTREDVRGATRIREAYDRSSSR